MASSGRRAEFDGSPRPTISSHERWPRYEIAIGGTPRTYRDTIEGAWAAAKNLKMKQKRRHLPWKNGCAGQAEPGNSAKTEVLMHGGGWPQPAGSPPTPPRAEREHRTDKSVYLQWLREKFDLLPPGDSISEANGVGSRSQGRFFFDNLELSPRWPRRRGFFAPTAHRAVKVARGRPSSGGETLCSAADMFDGNPELAGYRTRAEKARP